METPFRHSLAEGVDLGKHPGLVGVARGGHGLVDADHGYAVLVGELDVGLGQRVGDLLVVEEHPHLVLGEQRLLQRDVLRRRVDAVHDVGLECPRCEVVRAGRLEQVVGDRLGRGDRDVRVGGLERGDGAVPRRQAGGEPRGVGPVVGGVRGVDLAQVRRDRAGHDGHGCWLVPQVRVGHGDRQAQQLLHVDDRAAVARLCVLDGGGPVVVAGAVLHDQLGGGDLPGDGSARLERVRVSVRIAHDRRGLHVLAADLRDDVGVLVLRADGGDLGRRRDGGRRSRRGRAGTRQQGGRQRQGGGEDARAGSHDLGTPSERRCSAVENEYRYGNHFH